MRALATDRGAWALLPAMGFMTMFKKKEPKDLVREWQSKMRTEMRGVDRQIRGTLPSRTPVRPKDTFPRKRPTAFLQTRTFEVMLSENTP
jgi:hypothetical protein